MRVVVTGATGYLGSAIVEAVVRAGHDAVAVVRAVVDTSLAERDGIRLVEGDISRPETLVTEMAAADAVIHAASDTSSDGPNIDRRFVEHVLATTNDMNPALRFVYTSGLWVLGDSGDELADESSPTTAPAALVAWRPAVERIVSIARSSGIAAWTIRPGIVYGGSGGVTGMLFDSVMREGAVRIVGEGGNHWPLVHRDDLAELYVRVLERAPREQLLHATDGSRFTLATIAGAASRAGGGGGKVVSTALEDARRTMGAFADALALDQQVSNALARSVVDWNPRHRSFVDEAPALWSAYRSPPPSTRAREPAARGTASVPA